MGTFKITHSFIRYGVREYLLPEIDFPEYLPKSIEEIKDSYRKAMGFDDPRIDGIIRTDMNAIPEFGIPAKVQYHAPDWSFYVVYEEV